MNEKMAFVRNIHFLKGWFENDLKTLSFHFELVYYERNDVIYKEGEQLDGYLYFLKKGEVSLMKSF
jgi:CRP-like cAMP-binding protein